MQNPSQSAQPSTPPQPATSPQPGLIEVGQAAGATSSPTLVYRAARAGRDELKDQLQTLTDERHRLLAELDDHNDVSGPATSGMQQRIAQIDQRMAELDKSIAAADLQVSRAASIPGAVVAPPMVLRNGPPEEVFFMAPLVLLAVFLPISIAFARRIWRRNVAAVSEFPRELMERLGRLEQTGEATALEVERIGEGQRFVTRLLTERADRALGDPVRAQSQENS